LKDPIEVLCPSATCQARPGAPCQDMGIPYDKWFHPQREENARTRERQVSVLYDFSGGMESAAMLVVEQERIRATSAVVRLAHTGKQFDEFDASISQIERALDLKVIIVPQRITFDEFLFEKGGMLRKGMNDCSRRMKRGNLKRHMMTFPKPYEVNLGFNADEIDRAESFSDLNDRPWLTFRYPLIEAGISREDTRGICTQAGFSIVVEMYRKMGRFDCYFCPNQRPTQALRVVRYYPHLAAEWKAAEARKGHSFMPIPLEVLEQSQPVGLFEDVNLVACSCMGGTTSIHEEEDD
jgi:hypothetical protein